MATRNGNEAMVKLLLEAKADVSVRNHNGKTALDYAATYEFTTVVKLLPLKSCGLCVIGRHNLLLAEKLWQQKLQKLLVLKVS